MTQPVLIEREAVERGRLAVRAAVAAASALINDRVTPVPVDQSVALQLWFGLTAELLEIGGEEFVRAQLEQVLGFTAHNQGQIAALDLGASGALITHPAGCACALCRGVR